jgi:hypothetical protein
MKKTNLTKEQISTIVENVELDLLNQPKRQFAEETNWKNHFPDMPGVYAAFENSKLIYIGQTADLRARMSDISRTYNHTLRKKIGLSKLKGTIIKNKFSDDIEKKLTDYMVQNISFTFHALSFGRLEVESKLVSKYNNDEFYNSKSVRGIKNK